MISVALIFSLLSLSSLLVRTNTPMCINHGSIITLRCLMCQLWITFTENHIPSLFYPLYAALSPCNARLCVSWSKAGVRSLLYLFHGHPTTGYAGAELAAFKHENHMLAATLHTCQPPRTHLLPCHQRTLTASLRAYYQSSCLYQHVCGSYHTGER